MGFDEQRISVDAVPCGDVNIRINQIPFGSMLPREHIFSLADAWSPLCGVVTLFQKKTRCESRLENFSRIDRGYSSPDEA